MTTHITTAHRQAFEALTGGEYDHFALLSCFVNGDPAAAIVAVTRDGNEYHLHPAFRQRNGCHAARRP